MARRDPQIRRAPSASGLYDILDLILDKGIVIDAFVRVSLVGIELLTVDARVVIASVDTYLRYAEGAERLQLYNRSQSERLPEFLGQEMKQGTRRAGMNLAGKGAEAAGRLLGHREDDGGSRQKNPGQRGRNNDDDQDGDEQEHEGVAGKLTQGVRNVVGKLVHTVTGDDDSDDDNNAGSDDRGQQKGQPDRGRAEQQRGGKTRSAAGARR